MKWWRAGAVVAALAALHQVVLESLPTNDDFVHLALSRQLLGGDIPVRDFFDSGLTLQYGLSAAAQVLFGHRLLAEAIVVAVAFAISTYAVFALVRTLTGSTLAAVAAAMLLVLAGPRGYSYPKIIVYAVAAILWWVYAWTPSRSGAVALGVWTAIAFYWRPDHGVYVAAGVVLAMVAAHGLRWLTVTRGAVGAATAIALVLPFLVLVASTLGLVTYVRSGFMLARTQHTEMDSHAWPRWPILHVGDVVRLEPADAFAPVASLRWADTATPEVRRAVLARHRLAAIGPEGEGAVRVRLSDTTPRGILALINDPAVSDTAGIDRASASLPISEWPLWDRWRFRHAWLRVAPFPGLDDQRAASEATAAVFYALPALAFLVVAPVRRRLAVPTTFVAVTAFCAFAAIVNLGLLRTPYDVRAVDGVVMPAILLGCIVGVLLAMAAGGVVRRVAFGAAAMVLVVFTMKAVAVSGQFGDRVGWLAGDWRSVPRMRGAWSDMTKRLVAAPALSYWDPANAPLSIRLAQYANACVPASERLAVLWFAPEIYYYADRLMATRHVVFVPGLASPDEQRLTSEKFNRFSPPVVLATSGLSTFTRSVFPDLVADVERDYVQGGALDQDGIRYLVLVRRGRRATGTWGPQRWPCFR